MIEEAKTFNDFVGKILSASPDGNNRESEYKGAKVIDLRGLSDEQKKPYIERIREEIAQRLDIDDYNELTPTFAFASGKTEKEKYLENAYSFGKVIAEKGKVIITGAGSRSCMLEVAKGTRDNNGICIGVMTPDIFPIEGVSEHDGDENKTPVLHYLFLDDDISKRIDTERAFATVERDGTSLCNSCALAGGWGTLEEILEERLTGGKVVLEMPHWKNLHVLLKRMHELGYSATDPDDYAIAINSAGELKDINLPTADTSVQPISHMLAESAIKLRRELDDEGYGNVHISGANILRKHHDLQDTIERNDAFVVLPGDVHVLRELLGLIVEKRIATKKLDVAESKLAEDSSDEEANKSAAQAKEILSKKVYLVNEDGFYDPFLELYKELRTSGMLNARKIVDGKETFEPEDLFAFIDVVKSREELRQKLSEHNITPRNSAESSTKEIADFPVDKDKLIVVGTTNRAKAEEISAVMKAAGYEHVYSLLDISSSPGKFGLEEFDIEKVESDIENLKAGTLEANATNKVGYLAKKLKDIALGEKQGAYIISEESAITVYEKNGGTDDEGKAEDISRRRVEEWSGPDDNNELSALKSGCDTVYRSVVALAHTDNPQMSYTFYGARDMENHKLANYAEPPYPRTLEPADAHTSVSGKRTRIFLNSVGVGTKMLLHPRGAALRGMLNLACGMDDISSRIAITRAGGVHRDSLGANAIQNRR